MSQLPIEAVLPDLHAALQRHEQLILKAPPGAGKSTRLPIFLLENRAIAGKIVMLEPRRLAARNIAAYLAAQLGETIGQTIGLRMRGETKVSAATRLEIVTEGVMTRMLQQDPELSGIDLLIFDEFHERSLHADTSLALALEVQEALRDDLKLLVMSATLDHEALQTLLPDAGFLASEGRSFPVDYRYQSQGTAAQQNPGVATDWTGKQILKLLSEESGSMLVFLPGAGEIRRLAEWLEAAAGSDAIMAPLYGQLDAKAQQQAIQPAPKGKRKVVLATNIAETSLTIEGIRLVVDTGWERVSQWDPKTGISRLALVRIARSSAEQRAGRAGRLEPGICLRLYSEEMLTRQPAVPQPEILRADLSRLALELAQWGCASADELRWLDTPAEAALQQAKALLQALGALDERGQLTAKGQLIQQSGTEPRLAAMLAHARTLPASAQTTAALLVALLEEPARGIRNPDLAYQLHLLESDQLPRSQLYRQRARQHLATLRNGQDAAPGWRTDRRWLATLMAAGFPDRIALSRGQEGRFQLANGQGVSVDHEQLLATESALVVADVVKTRQGDSQVFTAVAADIEQLREDLPPLFHEREWLDWDDKKGRLVAEKQCCCGKLVIQRTPMAEPDPARASEALLNAIRRQGLSVLPWQARSESLRIRACCAETWLPELALPAMDDASLLASLEDWLLPFMTGIRTMKALVNLDLSAALEAYLGWDKTKMLDSALPTHYEVPTGSRYPIRYQTGQAPVLAVRMQEMFGEQASPVIANGKIAVVLELLSPAQRPLQITSDLAAFWQGAYKDVQKEMKGRYPKHVWPDDPASHAPTRKTKKYL
ncbi:ATP-dependent helicase HrpB [Photobacterium galatheae]|uniref:ATP-dependent helicase HrpB n=1 Tax=Photobacterium galatheae TaxID=1654360 RepID=A0A066RYG7_9GAMM|nr:ATP-dependent helicase HrpB [Photobacterium galatheae]KDM92692.1 ATP-dependent helicase HrpB [Photobacterium galatheae]MCM0149390.1 ATP-dependent helicase HrpB [Photobacterium galatheae]